MVSLTYSGDDSTNAIKQAYEFGLNTGQVLKTPSLFIQTAHAIGPEIGHGLTTTVGFYWNRNDAGRAFAGHFRVATRGNMPSQIHAGVYSAVGHYLRAVAAVGTDDGPTVMARMRETPVDDLFGEGARLRADGRLMKDMLSVEIKKAALMADTWDLFAVLGRVRAEEVIAPMDGSCKTAR